MIYTVKKAKLVSEQFQKFSTAEKRILIGQFPNLDFWLEELKFTIKALDKHNERFEKMCLAQKNWIESHNITIPDNCPICQGICELGTGTRKPSLPQKNNLNKRNKKEARKELIESAYNFLLRCYKLNLLNENDFRLKCAEIGTSVDFSDL